MPLSRDWVIVAVVAGAAGVAQTFGRFTYSLLLTDVRDDFGLSNTVAGALGTANLAAYLLATLVVSMVVGRVGVARMTRLGIVTSTIGIGLLAWSPTLVVFVIGQIITGTGGAAVWITAPSIATARIGPAHHGLAIGIAGMGIGGAIVISSAIEASVDSADWRTVYVVLVGLAAFVSALALWLLRDDPGRVAATRSGLQALRSLPGWRPLLGAYALYGLAVALIANFLVATLEEDSGYSPNEAAAAFSAFGVGTIFGGPSFGPLSDRWGRRWALVAAFVLMSLAAILVPTGPRPIPTVAAFLFGASFTGIPTGVAARIRDHIEGAAFGSSFGAATLAFGAALMLGPQIGGVLGDRFDSFVPVFVLASAAALVGGVLAWWGTATSVRLGRG